MPDEKKPDVCVLDTNLIVSGTILKRGIPFAVLEAWKSGQLILACSSEQRAEIQDVLTRPEIRDRYHLTEG